MTISTFLPGSFQSHGLMISFKTLMQFVAIMLIYLLIVCIHQQDENFLRRGIISAPAFRTVSSAELILTVLMNERVKLTP
jgi:hypothetical protein